MSNSWKYKQCNEHLFKIFLNIHGGSRFNIYIAERGIKLSVDADTTCLMKGSAFFWKMCHLLHKITPF